MKVTNAHLVDQQTLKSFKDIDGFKVIEEYLLFKGTDNNKLHIPFIRLIDMAFITYGLKVNATTKLYVGLYLEKFCHRNDLFSKTGKDKIVIPDDIWIKVNEIHQRFKNPLNSSE